LPQTIVGVVGYSVTILIDQAAAAWVEREGVVGHLVVIRIGGGEHQILRVRDGEIELRRNVDRYIAKRIYIGGV
jgi:hypothetical protein